MFGTGAPAPRRAFAANIPDSALFSWALADPAAVLRHALETPFNAP